VYLYFFINLLKIRNILYNVYIKKRVLPVINIIKIQIFLHSNNFYSLYFNFLDNEWRFYEMK